MDADATRPAPKETIESEALVSVLATTDLHMHLYPHDYATDRPDPRRGLAALARHVAVHRARTPNGILVDNGDVIQGTAMGDWAAGRLAADHDAAHPAITAMNLLGYDAATVGNHEFDYGLGMLRRCHGAAGFPVVLANLRPAGDAAEALFPPWTILRREIRDLAGRWRRLRIGVVGFAPVETLTWDRARLGGALRAEPMADCARRMVPELRAAGADIVIALCHAGIDDDSEGESRDADAGALDVARVPGVDAVVAGHSHTLHAAPSPVMVPGAGRGAWNGESAGARLSAGPRAAAVPEPGLAPIVSPGSRGTHLGRIDLRLRCRDDGRCSVLRGSASLVPATALPAAPGAAGTGEAAALYARVLNALEPAHRRTLARIRRPVTELSAPLTSYFADAGDHAMARCVARAVRAHLDEVGLDRSDGTPLLVATSLFSTGGRGDPSDYVDIAPGPLLVRDLARLSPFANTVQVRRVRGAVLRQWLERSARAFRTVTPGARDAPLRDLAVPGYDIDTVDGLGWRIDLSRPVGDRVRDMVTGDGPLAEDDPVDVAVTDYRAAGSNGFPDLADAQLRHADASTVPDILARMLGRLGPGDNEEPRCAGWRFAAMPGTTVRLRTGPGARRHKSLARRLGLEDTGVTDAEGYALFRLHL
ncbi:5'-nucleotidase C-terminal domain-containing protein [Roseivivax marinus]|uniref:5'-nucleotidase C-terminal domain-containing protein n=1 Tax=Roseivivax marinus TaxID=1379903 RepID=UPI00273FBDEC|nr:5'-nucleotidase C-terminal domain-containing protein [Roseivivax marinus]